PTRHILPRCCSLRSPASQARGGNVPNRQMSAAQSRAGQPRSAIRQANHPPPPEIRPAVNGAATRWRMPRNKGEKAFWRALKHLNYLNLRHESFAYNEAVSIKSNAESEKLRTIGG